MDFNCSCDSKENVKFTFESPSRQSVPMSCVWHWIVRHLPYTRSRRCLLRRTILRLASRLLRCFVSKTYSELATNAQPSGRIVPLKFKFKYFLSVFCGMKVEGNTYHLHDIASNHTRPASRCNDRERPDDSTDVSCASVDKTTTLPSTCHIAPYCSGRRHHHNHRIHTVAHRMRRYPNTNALFPWGLCSPIDLSSGCTTRPLRDHSDRHIWRDIFELIEFKWIPMVFDVDLPADHVKHFSECRHSRSWSFAHHRGDLMPSVVPWIIAFAFIVNGKQAAATCAIPSSSMEDESEVKKISRRFNYCCHHHRGVTVRRVWKRKDVNFN